MPRTHRISVSLNDAELARLDELRSRGVSRSAFVRALVRQAAPLAPTMTYPEVLALLSERARSGNITATVSLERALRAAPGDAQGGLDSVINEILGD